MPTLRRGGTEGSRRPAGPARILLDSDSPYGSRRLVVEYDGTTTAAYVHYQRPDRGHLDRQPRAGPGDTDPAPVEAGQAPLMPAAHTKHPGGRPLLDPGTLRALWLEEGDGVVLVEGGRLLAVLPGWSRHGPRACPATAGT